MIDLLEGFPENTVAGLCRGRVTKRDYDQVLIPKVNEVLGRGGPVRLYYEIGKEFEGVDAAAMWEDFMIGMKHLRRWERMAVVTDTPWIRGTMKFFGAFMPGKLRVFPTSAAEAAREWIKA